MSTGIRRVGIVMIVLFVGLVAQLTYLQVGRSEQLADDPMNSRVALRDIARARGPIVSADGVILANSIPVDDQYKYQRIYPAETASLFAHIVGYQSIQNGSTGVERTYSSELAGRTFELQTSGLADVFATRQPVGTVVLTTSRQIQQIAADALGGQRGSVVVLDVRTGGVVAMYSNPTYDPNMLATHNVRRANNVKIFLDAAPDKPLLPRAWAEIYPPGSTFKAVTASIAVDRNVDVDTVFPEVRSIELPQTNGQRLFNFGGSLCGGTLRESFVRSCNTTFAQVGFDLGDQLAEGIQNFGVETDPPNSKSSGIDPKIVKSRGPERGTFRFNQPDFMKDAIGQQDVAVTPLQMALVAQAVANGGVILEPHVVDCVLDPDNRVVSKVGRAEYKRAMSPATAATITDFMVGVVNEGTARAAQIPGVLVAGKTGTAETAPGARPHAWFIAFAPADAPQYAVAVLVERGGEAGGGDAVTGGRVAAPIAKTVLEALLATPPPPSPCSGQPVNSGSDG